MKLVGEFNLTAKEWSLGSLDTFTGPLQKSLRAFLSEAFNALFTESESAGGPPYLHSDPLGDDVGLRMRLLENGPELRMNLKEFMWMHLEQTDDQDKVKQLAASLRVLADELDAAAMEAFHDSE